MSTSSGKRYRSLRYPLLFIFIALFTVNFTLIGMWLINRRPKVYSFSQIDFPEEILVPVTGFYNFDTTNITSAELDSLEQIYDTEIDPNDKNVYSISLDDLDANVRVINIDGKYPLDQIIEENDKILTINQTGVTALTRAMLNKLNVVKEGSYFAEDITSFLSSADITHTSNEVSFADDCNNQLRMTLCSTPSMYSALASIGVDVVELTGNHNNDWGTTANLETIAKYHEDNIKTFGGGEDEETASIPLELNEKDTKITWLGVNYSTSTQANGQGAVGNRPGANIYDEELVSSQIQAAKEQGAFVIVDVQYFECYSYPDDGEEMPSCDYPISGQEAFFKHLVDLGADLVVGTQAHQPQTFELYDGAEIFYGLGNLFFDQTYWPGTMRSLILTHYFAGQKLLQTRITPTMYDNNYQTHIMDEADAKNFLTRLADASPAN